MDLNNTIAEGIDDFKRNTGILLPISKFILSNSLLLGLLFIIPFKIFFWIYQIGYLSTFGINYDLILRSSFEAQGLWGEMISSFSDVVIIPVWGCFVLCLLLGLFGFIRNGVILFKRVSITKNKVQNKKQPVKKSHFSRILKMYSLICRTRGVRVFNMASMSYGLSVVFIVIILCFTSVATFVHKKGQEQSKLRFDNFHNNKQCYDGWGQSGCYSLEKKGEKYEGYLVAMNEKSVYLMTNNKLMIIPKSDDLVIQRTLIKSY
jgi:hypothetical protein